MDIEIKADKILCFTDELKYIADFNSLDIKRKPLLILKRDLKKIGKFVISIDLNVEKDFNKVCKKIIHLYKYCLKNNIQIGDKKEKKMVIAYINHCSEKAFKDIKDFFCALFIEDLKTRYNFIYDIVCKELDDVFRCKNLCDFKNDSCIHQRVDNTKNKTMGCCYSFYYRKDGIPVDTGLCKHLSDKGCKVKCLTCKMFTCKYLRKKGFYFSINDFLLLDVFLNKKQKKYLKESFFKTQDEIIDNWLKNA